MTYFIVEFTILDDRVEEELVKLSHCKLYVDGASNYHYFRITLKGKCRRIYYASMVEFRATNNEAEYVMLIARFKIANELRVKALHRETDLTIVDHQ